MAAMLQEAGAYDAVARELVADYAIAIGERGSAEDQFMALLKSFRLGRD